MGILEFFLAHVAYQGLEMLDGELFDPIHHRGPTDASKHKDSD